RSTIWREDQVQRRNASAMSAGGLSAMMMTIAIIAGGRLAAAGTMTTIAAARCRHGTMKASSLAPDHVTMMTMIAVGRCRHGTMKAGSLAPGHVTTMTTIAVGRCRHGTMKAGLRARGHVTVMMTTGALHVRGRAIMMTMMTGAVAAGMAAGTVIPRVTLRPHIAVGRSVAVRAAAIATMTAGARCRRGTMKAGSPAPGPVTMKSTGAVAAGMAACTAIPRATPKRHGAAGKSAAVLTPVIETMTTIAAARCLRGTTRAGSPACGRATTMSMTISAAAAGMAAGTAIRKAIPRRHAAAADNPNRPSI